MVEPIYDQIDNVINNFIILSILLFKGFFLFEFLIFWFKNTPTPLYLSKDKIKGQYYYLRGLSCLDSLFFSLKMPLHLYI